ncbi:MAG: S8 family serine peptidase [Thermomicrobiales bacterium]|nr:S8 family serine peptidase [Thermomicrobiales bacterium]
MQVRLILAFVLALASMPVTLADFVASAPNPGASTVLGSRGDGVNAERHGKTRARHKDKTKPDKTKTSEAGKKKPAGSTKTPAAAPEAGPADTGSTGVTVRVDDDRAAKPANGKSDTGAKSGKHGKDKTGAQHKSGKGKHDKGKAKARGKHAPIALETGVVAGAASRAARAVDPGKRYIVALQRRGVDVAAATADLGNEPGVIQTAIYQHVLSGFAAYLTPDAKRALERDPRVAAVEPDREVFLAAQTLPDGIKRIGGDLNSTAKIDGNDGAVGVERVDADVAVIDTGVDLTHPDLNVAVYADCTEPTPPSPPAQFDQDGHGTHVSGTVGAIDNGSGVVGVAPGARIWAFRVMDDAGHMMYSYIITCLDAAADTLQAPVGGQSVDVINMSLGGAGSDSSCAGSSFHTAICNTVAAGITVVVAAGNDTEDAANFIPAAYDEVIAVSALADNDGQRGGLGGTFLWNCTSVQQHDDRLATFSNYGADVDIAAPGMNVLSTFPTYKTPECSTPLGTGYSYLAGTSMASPHVAGAAALVKAEHPGYSPAQVKSQLQSDRERWSIPGDPDGIDEGVLNVGTDVPTGDKTPPTVSLRAPAKAKVGKWFNIPVSAQDASGIQKVMLYVCDPACRPGATDTTAPYGFSARTKRPGRLTLFARAYDNAGNAADSAHKTVTIAKAKKKKHH